LKRKTIKINGLNLSYLDNEREGKVLICLHGHYGTASMFAFLDNHYSGRLISLDQRGHGLSDHAGSYTRDDYIDDLRQFIDALRIKNPILLGHSLGGINVLQYAAKYKNVSKLIIEDIGTIVAPLDNFFSSFPPTFDSVWEVNQEFQKKGRPISAYFLESLYYDGIKWRFRFDYDEIVKSIDALVGEYWDDWDKVDCPILLLHGMKSWACTTENIKEMASRNKNATLKIFENASHAIHEDERQKFLDDLLGFLGKN